MTLDARLIFMTAARSVNYLPQSIASFLLANRGTDLPIDVVIGSWDTDFVKPIRHHHQVRLHGLSPQEWERIREWRVHKKLSFNFWKALCLGRDSHADAIICEDDIVFCQDFLERVADVVGEVRQHGHESFVLALYSPFDFASDPGRKRGRYYCSTDATKHYGNCCLYISQTILAEAADYVWRAAVEPGDDPADLALGRFGEHLWQTGRSGMYQAISSLAQHVGFVSGGTSGSYCSSPTFGRPWPHRLQSNTDVAIFIPTYRRADRLEAVVKNAVAASGQAKICVIVEPDDVESVRKLQQLTGSSGLVDSGAAYPTLRTLMPKQRLGSYAKAINFGFEQIRHDPAIRYFFCGADDLRFEPGWLEACRSKMVGEIAVVGTNDLGNPLVLSGEHATHFLVSVAYILECSGTVDRTGVVLHEGYDHNFTDTEFIATAKSRGVFAPCLEAVVEHNHFLFSKSTKDATYEKGYAQLTVDQALFNQRSANWTAGVT